MRAKWPRLRASSERAATCHREIGDRDGMATAAGWIARALCARGRFDEALRFVEVCEEGSSDDAGMQSWCRSTRAIALAGMGLVDEAVVLAREAVAIAQPREYVITLGDALLDLAEVLRAAGEGDEAAQVARDALGVFEQKEEAFSAERARALLASLGASDPNGDSPAAMPR